MVLARLLVVSNERRKSMPGFKKSSLTDNFHHVGIIVKDVDKVVNFYESLGIGPFEPLVITAKERKLRGKPLKGLKLKIRIAHVGSTRIEGIAHIAFVVDDIEKSKAELTSKGLKILFETWFENGGAAAYFESDEIGWSVLEILQRPADYNPH
jgi:methylmalonyl-CoA/ethylmalonyl-CoA epimerase